jgi:hypothetical protein
MPADLAARYAAFLRRHATAVALAGCALLVGAAVVAARLELRADLAELLPQDDPALLELRHIAAKVGAPATLVVAVESPDRAANERFADALAANLAPLVGPGRPVRGLDYRADAAKAFYTHNQALYAALPDLERITEDLEQMLRSKKNPAYVALSDPERDLKELQAELERRARSRDHFPTGYFEGEGGRLLAMILWTSSSGTGDASGFQIRDAVQRAVDATGPAGFGVRATLTGDVASAIEEHDSLKSDIELVSLLCTVLVLGVIVFYFRSALAVPFIFVPTLAGVATAFAVTRLVIGYVNTNTAFLGSIILGNGINFGIIFLARVREGRARGEGADAAVAAALRTTAGPTLVAALAAAIAYGSLGVTRFRGFQQFGFVGGLGMVLCWLATYCHAPALILLVDRWQGRRAGAARPAAPTAAFPTGACAWLLRRPATLLGLTGAATIIALVAAAFAVRNPFDYDFRKLRNQSSEKRGAGQMYKRVGAIFESHISPLAVALLGSPEQAAAFRVALLEKDCRTNGRLPAAECARRVAAGEPTLGLLQDVRTAWQLLPPQQPEHLELVARLRRVQHDKAMAHLDADERRTLDERTPPEDLRALGVADLPDALARPYRELDGTVGRVALVYPVTRGFEAWNGHDLLRMSDLIRDVALPDPAQAPVHAAGRASVFADMLRAILRDGPRATLAALLGVVVLVVVFFRLRRAAWIVLASLAVGVVWMVGAAAALGLRLNFLNFVALPVTLGIGVDYAVNVAARLATEPRASWARAVAQTGSAVALCSSTTIIGYSTLLVADNGALRSFGTLANLGEIGCLLAALLVVPPLAARLGRSRRRTGAAVASCVPIL